MNLAQALERLRAAHGATRLSYRQISVLEAVVRAPGRSVKHIAEELGMSVANCSRVVTALGQRGMTETLRLPGNHPGTTARLVAVVPLEPGRTLLASAEPGPPAA